jgi:hypothetical protein
MRWISRKDPGALATSGHRAVALIPGIRRSWRFYSNGAAIVRGARAVVAAVPPAGSGREGPAPGAPARGRGPRGRPEADQKASEEITSPLARVPSAHQVAWLIPFFTNRTLPSPISALTPPGWLLLTLANVASLG